MPRTTAGVARFNNSSSQLTVLVLQNTGGAVSGHAWFWGGAGGLLGVHAFALAPRAALVLPTASVPGVSGASGSSTVSHDGSFGQIEQFGTATPWAFRDDRPVKEGEYASESQSLHRVPARR